MDDDSMALIYGWNSAEDYWRGALPEGSDDPAEPFSHASGLDLFEAAARRLSAAGVGLVHGELGPDHTRGSIRAACGSTGWRCT